MLVGSESPTVTLHRPPPRESRVNSRLRPAPAASPEESRLNSRLGPAPATSPEESRVNSRLGPVSKLTRAPPLQRQGRVAASAAAPGGFSRGSWWLQPRLLAASAAAPGGFTRDSWRLQPRLAESGVTPSERS